MSRKTSTELTNMCMIYDDKGNVLVEEKLWKNTRGLTFPGGHIEPNESITTSVIREIKEETGLLIESPFLCGVKDWIEKDGTRYIIFLFSANRFSGELCSSEEGKVFWMPLDELNQKPPFWHLDKMLEIFFQNGATELYFDKNQDGYSPVLQ